MTGNLFLASSNEGKLAEFIALARSATLEAPAFELALLSNFSSFPAFDESAPTFAENAAGKALHYSRLAECRILADDSGLVVPALDGAPGVKSARYAGANATSEQRNEKLLDAMRSLTGEHRRAYFVCVLAVAEKGRPIAVVSARADGEILDAPSGQHGFGYDPVFYIPELHKTLAELMPEEKNNIGHRGKAYRRLLEVVAAARRLP